MKNRLTGMTPCLVYRLGLLGISQRSKAKAFPVYREASHGDTGPHWMESLFPLSECDLNYLNEQ